MLLSSILLVPTIAHAATGTVSVNGGNQIVTAQTATTVSVPIQIMGSDALNGFDIQVSADPTVLSGGSVSLAGSLFASPRIVLECINGVLVTGNACAPQDASGIVHLQVVQLGTNIPDTGTQTLFTINYNIVGTSPLTAINFNSGCTGTSVAGLCVTISNGTTTPLSETAVSGSFANLNDFSQTATFAKVSSPAGTPISDVINYAALGAFSDTLTETLSGSGAACSIGGSVNLAFFPTGTDTLTCSSATNSDFSTTVTAKGASSGISHSVIIKVHFGPAGFSSALSQPSVNVAAGTSDSSTTITVTGVSGFSGTVTLAATGSAAGITGTASPSMVTLTNDGSGYSTASSTLTVNVAASVASGTYSVSVTGGSTLAVIVPSRDFSIAATPSLESVPRGGSAVVTLTLTSTGSFAGTVNLSAVVIANGLNAGTGTNNIVPTFIPSSVTLTAGSTATVAFSAATVKIGTGPNAGDTATGNYTATITATGAASPHTVSISFNVEDFSFGPSFCPGSSQQIFTTPNNVGNFGFGDPFVVGEQCNTFTLTTQTADQGGSESTLYLQVNSLGGFQSFGADGHGVAAVNPFGPGRGTFVPALGFRVCFFQVFLPNGTQLSRSYISANGPIVRENPFNGCRFNAFASPNDVEAPICPGVVNATCGSFNNVDFFAVVADALPTTLPGTYLINVCGLAGILLNCQMVTLDVVQAAIVHQLVFTHTVSIAAGGLQSFKLGVTNPDLNFAVFAQVTVTATDQLGGTVSVSTAVFKINPNANTNNIALSLTFTSADVGKTFTFSASILESATDPGAVTVDTVNGFTGAGTSTVQSVIAIFTVTK